jgi:hypothetical protein
MNALDKFNASTNITYELWHDGVPYDLNTLMQLTPDEHAEIVRRLGARRQQDWRDVDVYHAVGTPEALKFLQRCLTDRTAGTRIAAAERLQERGLMPDLDDFLANELRHVGIVDGMVVALRLAFKYPSETVKIALLEGSKSRKEVGPHYAAALCYITGVTNSDFEMSMRPFFLRFGDHNSAKDRAAAYLELCRMTGLDESRLK